MAHKVYLYPKWIRFWHVVNALMFLILIATGLAMQYTNASGWLLQELGAETAEKAETTTFLMNFATAITWHNVAGIIVTVGFVVFLIGNFMTGNVKNYNPREKSIFKNMLIQLRFYAYGIFRGESHPFPINENRKFNPLQKVSYIFAMYIAMPLLVLSGLAMLFPEVVPTQIFGVSGLVVNVMVHIISGYTLSMFMIIHIYTCTLGQKPTTLYRGMITGYHEGH